MIDYHQIKLDRVARFIDNHDCDMRVVRITDNHVVCETRSMHIDGYEVIDIDYVSTIRGAKCLLGY